MTQNEAEREAWSIKGRRSEAIQTGPGPNDWAVRTAPYRTFTFEPIDWTIHYTKASTRYLAHVGDPEYKLAASTVAGPSCLISVVILVSLLVTGLLTLAVAL